MAEGLELDGLKVLSNPNYGMILLEFSGNQSDVCLLRDILNHSHRSVRSIRKMLCKVQNGKELVSVSVGPQRTGVLAMAMGLLV